MAETHEKDMQFEKEEGEEEEYVLLQLDDCLYSDVQSNASYVLSNSSTSFLLAIDIIFSYKLHRAFALRCHDLWTCKHQSFFSSHALITEGLDTLTPTLILGDGLKMTGEYQETIGTCYLFSETNAPPKPIHGEMATPGENKDKQASCSKEVPSKEVKHLASVQKILKFRSINADREQRRAYRDNDKEF